MPSRGSQTLRAATKPPRAASSWPVSPYPTRMPGRGEKCGTGAGGSHATRKRVTDCTHRKDAANAKGPTFVEIRRHSSHVPPQHHGRLAVRTPGPWVQSGPLPCANKVALRPAHLGGPRPRDPCGGVPGLERKRRPPRDGRNSGTSGADQHSAPFITAPAR
jgi:hypothetical protein